jgi:GntR family transcriptional regulator
MFFHIDPSDGLAIYDQVVRQVKFAVASRVLCPGNLVPSVRELARELAINPNTVARAYQQLQADGVLQTVRGMGLEVAADAQKHCCTERQKLIRLRVRQALTEARQSGLSEDELRTVVDEELAGVLAEGR